MPELSLSGLRQRGSFKGSFQFIMTHTVVQAVTGDGDVLSRWRSGKMAAALLQQSLMVQDVQLSLFSWCCVWPKKMNID